MGKIAASACLCGIPCRYDGRDNRVEAIARLYQQGRVQAVCPEVQGGLPVPRTPCELCGGRVLDRDGGDRTDAFLQGAQKALQLAVWAGARVAVLKEGSPSCGCRRIYDGSFSGVKIPGMGVAARLFQQEGIRVFSENELEEALAVWREADPPGGAV